MTAYENKLRIYLKERPLVVKRQLEALEKELLELEEMQSFMEKKIENVQHN